jgi:hypothetical protein
MLGEAIAEVVPDRRAVPEVARDHADPLVEVVLDVEKVAVLRGSR